MSIKSGKASEGGHSPSDVKLRLTVFPGHPGFGYFIPTGFKPLALVRGFRAPREIVPHSHDPERGRSVIHVRGCHVSLSLAFVGFGVRHQVVFANNLSHGGACQT